MNLVFLNPYWIAAIPPVILAGWWLARNTGTPVAVFTIPEFWPAASTPALHAANRRHTRINRFLLVIVAAAAAALLAVARPQILIPPSNRAPPEIDAVGRMAPNHTRVQLFVRVAADSIKSFPFRSCRINASCLGRTWTKTVSPRRIIGGVLFRHLPVVPDIAVSVWLRGNSRGGDIHQQLLLMRRRRPTPVYVNAASQLPAALSRLLHLLPDIQWNRPHHNPAIWVFSGPRQLDQDRAFIRTIAPSPTHTIVLCIGPAAAPAMRVTGIVRQSPSGRPIIIAPDNRLFHAVNFSSVHVDKMYGAVFDKGWHPKIRVGNHIWLAKLTTVRTGVTWYWLASPPSRQFTDWQHHTSFVVFFMNMLSGISSSSGRSADWWRPKSALASGSPAPVSAAGNTYPLAAPLSLLAAGLALIAAAGLARFPAGSRAR